MKKYGRFILSFVSFCLAFAMGGVLYVLVNGSSAVMIALGVLSVLPVVLFALNLCLGMRFVNRINRMKVADMQAYLLRHRDEAEATSQKKLRQLQTARRLTAVYTVFVWLLGCAISMLGTFLGIVTTVLVPLCMLYAVLVFYAAYSRFYRDEPLVFDENTIYLSKTDYPTLYSHAQRAADALGCQDEIAIILSLDCNARIIRDKRRYVLQIGIVLLHVLSEEELYHVLLHEFSHVTEAQRPAMRERSYNAFISSQGERTPPQMGFVLNLFLRFDIYYSFNHMLYQYASSVTDELAADRAMMQTGTPDVAVSALLKLQYDNMYFWESAVKNEKSLYFPAEPTEDYLSDKIEKFKRAIEERHDDWDAMVGKEILPNNASHPTLRMRMEALGVTELKSVSNPVSESYAEELKKALAHTEKLVFEERKKTYEKDRKEMYVDPVTRVNEWWESDMPLAAETYADVVSDLKLIGLHEEAEKLCDRAIAELNENESVHAYFMKGCSMLYRYDERGMEYLYHALEKNLNYLEEGLEVMGQFCCYTGREKELNEYREFAARLSQKHKDEDSQANFLSKHDRLSAEQLPDGMLEDILSFIHSVDEDIIENIYLVRKTVSDSFFTSAFVIHFYGGTDAQRDEIMHKIFRYLDAYPTEWQFSLFDYFAYPEVQVEKIKGSLVYSKSKETENKKQNNDEHT